VKWREEKDDESLFDGLMYTSSLHDQMLQTLPAKIDIDIVHGESQEGISKHER